MIDPVLLKPQPRAPGTAKISGGATQYGIPFTYPTSISTSGLSANVIRYVPLIVLSAVRLSQVAFEVTIGPLSDANVRIGIYAADSDYQPAGSCLSDSSDIAVATAFTGVKTAAVSVNLPAGIYLIAINTSVAMTIRTYVSGTTSFIAALGASSGIQRFEKSSAYAAFASPGVAWDTVNAANAGQQNFCVWQWTTL